MKDYYKILEVNKEASPEIIAKVYKILAKKYHPDLQKDSNKSECEEKFKEISEAYETLSDPEKRSVYDSSLNEYLNQSKVDRSDYETLVDYCVELEKKLNDISNPPTAETTSNRTAYYSQQTQQATYANTNTNTTNNTQNGHYNPYNGSTTYHNIKRNYSRYTNPFKDMFKNTFAFLITVAIMYIAFKLISAIPALNEYFSSLFTI